MPRRRFAALAAAAAPVVGATLVALLGAREARAAEAPTGQSFDIWYYATDEDGDRDRLFSADDLAGFVNRARCECNQTISTRIQLQRAMSVYEPTIRVQTFVGNRCADAQTSVNPQIKPCLRVLSDAPNAYTKAINFEFSPLWLVAGVDLSQGTQDLGNAVPSGSCETGQGSAGIWICIENGEQPDCQNNEFEVTGTQNKNSLADSMMALGISYDFDPPQTLPDNFSISAGDSALQIEWDQISTGDVSGFRVLCADADGAPLPGKGIDPPSLVGINRGTTYFIARDLCPDGPFSGEDEPIDTGDDSTTGAGSTGDLESSGGLESSGSDSTGTGTGTDTGTGTGTDTGTGTGTDGGTTGAPLPADGIESLGYAYVCSGHISGTSQEARITGLDNGVEYQILIVAYDLAGNPVAASPVLVGIPVETIDLWEQCEIDGDICGSGGFCNCTSEPDADARGWFVLMAAVGLFARRRRRS